MRRLSFWTDPASILIFLFITFECLDSLLKLHLRSGRKDGIPSTEFNNKCMENICYSVYAYTKQ